MGILWRIARVLLLPIGLILVIPIVLIAILLFLPVALTYGVRRRYRLITNRRPLAALRARLGWGRSVRRLARTLGMTVHELTIFQPIYREVFIPKRRGGKRRLLIPDEPTKSLQRRILRRLLTGLHSHWAACGFETCRSIVHAAQPHSGQAVVIKIDIRHFFPSTAAHRVEAYFRRIGWSGEAAALLTRLTTTEGGLPQGAPTSPRLSNLINYYLDVQLGNLAARRSGEYTRYADDITISYPKDYPRHVRGTIQQARRILKSKGYQIHHRKLRILRQHQRQTVTGLVVNDGVNLPRKTRRWLRAVEHRHRNRHREPTLSVSQLQGWRALAAMIKTAKELDRSNEEPTSE
jgi:retron-type reverse transcriptase